MAFISVLQNVLAVLGLLSIGLLQALSAIELVDTPKYKSTYTNLVKSAIVALVSVVVLTLIAVLVGASTDSTNVLNNVVLLLTSVLMLVTGSYSAQAAISLQCDAKDPATPEPQKRAWKYTTASAALGIGGTIVLLFIQAFYVSFPLADFFYSGIINWGDIYYYFACWIFVFFYIN